MFTFYDGRNAIEFSGTTDRLSVFSSPSLSSITDGQSISLWYYGNFFPQGALVSRFFEGMSSRIWVVGPQLSGQLNVLDNVTYIGGTAEHFGGAFMSVGWNHLAVAFDFVNAEASVYVNNGPPLTRTLNTTGFNSPSDWFIGNNPDPSNAGNAPVSVRISDIRVFDHALSAIEVNGIFNE